MNSAMKQYAQVGAQAAVGGVSRHRLIEMLFEGALDRIAAAKGHMARGEIAEKGATISRVADIIDGLRAGLDMNVGGDLARNLDDLYDYMGRRLVESNANNSPAILDEVAGLLREIQDAWSAIPMEYRDVHPASEPQVSAG